MPYIQGLNNGIIQHGNAWSHTAPLRDSIIPLCPRVRPNIRQLITYELRWVEWKEEGDPTGSLDDKSQDPICQRSRQTAE